MQPAQTWSLVAVPSALTYSPAGQTLSSEQPRSLVAVGAADSHSSAAHSESAAHSVAGSPSSSHSPLAAQSTGASLPSGQYVPASQAAQSSPPVPKVPASQGALGSLSPQLVSEARARRLERRRECERRRLEPGGEE